MKCVSLFVIFLFIAYNGKAYGRVLKDIIDLLVANPRTRYMIKAALARMGRNGITGMPMPTPLLYPMNIYETPHNMPINPMYRGDEPDDERFPMGQPFLIDAKTYREFNSGFPWKAFRNNYPNYMAMKNSNNQPNVQWKDDESLPGPDKAEEQGDRENDVAQEDNANYLPPSPKFMDQGRTPSGLALEVNGDMKAVIPPGSPWRKPGRANYQYYQPLPPRDYFQSPFAYPMVPRAAADIAPDDIIERDNGPLSDEMFEKKRVIIRELKRLFQVLFDGETIGSERHNRYMQFIRGAKKAKFNQKKSKVAGSKEVKPVKKSYRPSKRLALYKRLIGDLNSLIALEIQKVSGHNKTEAVNVIPAALPKPIETENVEDE